MGWYPDGTVIILGDNEPSQPSFTLLGGLSFAIALIAGQGDFAVTLELRGPDGTNVLPAGDSVRLQKLPRSAATLNVRLAPLAGRFGTYVMVMKLDGRPYEFSFVVRSHTAEERQGAVAPR